MYHYLYDLPLSSLKGKLLLTALGKPFELFKPSWLGPSLDLRAWLISLGRLSNDNIVWAKGPRLSLKMEPFQRINKDNSSITSETVQSNREITFVIVAMWRMDLETLGVRSVSAQSAHLDSICDANYKHYWLPRACQRLRNIGTEMWYLWE